MLMNQWKRACSSFGIALNLLCEIISTMLISVNIFWSCKKLIFQMINITYLTTNATRAKNTTMASKMFQASRKYEPGWSTTPRSITFKVEKSSQQLFHDKHTQTNNLFLNRKLNIFEYSQWCRQSALTDQGWSEFLHVLSNIIRNKPSIFTQKATEPYPGVKVQNCILQAMVQLLLLEGLSDSLTPSRTSLHCSCVTILFESLIRRSCYCHCCPNHSSWSSYVFLSIQKQFRDAKHR